MHSIREPTTVPLAPPGCRAFALSVCSRVVPTLYMQTTSLTVEPPCLRPTRRLHVQPRLLDFVTTHVHNLVSGCSRAAQRVSAAVGGRSGGICSSKARRAIAAGLSAAQREQVDGAPSSCGVHLGTAAASLIGCVSKCGIFCPRDVSGSYGHEMHARDALLSCTAMRGHARA